MVHAPLAASRGRQLNWLFPPESGHNAYHADIASVPAAGAALAGRAAAVVDRADRAAAGPGGRDDRLCRLRPEPARCLVPDGHHGEHGRVRRGPAVQLWREGVHDRADLRRGRHGRLHLRRGHRHPRRGVPGRHLREAQDGTADRQILLIHINNYLQSVIKHCIEDRTLDSAAFESNTLLNHKMRLSQH